MSHLQTEGENQAIAGNNDEKDLVILVVDKGEPEAVESMDISHVTVVSESKSPSESVNLSANLMMDLDQAVFKTLLKRNKYDTDEIKKFLKLSKNVKGDRLNQILK